MQNSLLILFAGIKMKALQQHREKKEQRRRNKEQVLEDIKNHSAQLQLRANALQEEARINPNWYYDYEYVDPEICGNDDNCKEIISRWDQDPRRFNFSDDDAECIVEEGWCGPIPEKPTGLQKIGQAIGQKVGLVKAGGDPMRECRKAVWRHNDAYHRSRFQADKKFNSNYRPFSTSSRWLPEEALKELERLHMAPQQGMYENQYKELVKSGKINLDYLKEHFPEYMEAHRNQMSWEYRGAYGEEYMTRCPTQYED